MSNRLSARTGGAPILAGRSSQVGFPSCTAPVSTGRPRPMRSAWLTRPARSVPASRSPTPAKGFTGLIKRLGSLGVDGVAIERSDGPLVEAMLEADLRVVVVTPAGQGLRSRYQASGAKSDPADAYLLADVLRTDGHRLAALTPDSEPTKILQALSRTARTWSRPGSRWSASSPASWKAFPGAIGLFHELHSPTAVAFLRRSPTGHAAAALTGQPRCPPAPPALRPHAVSELLRACRPLLAGISPAVGGRTGSPCWPTGSPGHQPPGTRRH